MRVGFIESQFGMCYTFHLYMHHSLFKSILDVHLNTTATGKCSIFSDTFGISYPVLEE